MSLRGRARRRSRGSANATAKEPLRSRRSRRAILLGVTAEASLTLMRGQSSYLSGRDWEVHVVSSATVTEDSDSVHHSVAMQRDPSLLSDLVGLLRWVQVIWRVRPTVVMVGTPKAGLLGILAATATFRRRRVYLLRGLRLETASGWRRALLWTLELIVCRLATDVLAVSRSLADEVVRLRLVPRGRVRVLGSGSSNGVDVCRFAPVPATTRVRVREELGIGSNSLVVGFVGRLTRDKGVVDLVDAFHAARLPVDSALLIVGPVEDPRVAERIADVSSKSRERSIICVGESEDVRSLYGAMDVLALPSYREGFPNVVIEAGACQVPTITSDATGCRDAVLPGRTGWIHPVGNVTALGRALEAAASSPEERRARGQAARRWIAQEFDRDLVWSRLGDFLDEGSSASGRME